MNPKRWRQIDALLELALDQPAEQRAAFLDTACAGDEALRSEVETLLLADAQAENLIEVPVASLAGKALAQAQAVAMTGREFGHYKILSPLGAGGMGEVYLAEDTRLRRKVALKLLPARFTSDAERLRRFEMEGRAVSALNHPNILTIHEIGQTSQEEGGACYIITEYIEGQTLRQQLAGGRLTLRAAVEVALQTASALVAAHAAGIVHRDIKPENVMVRPDALVKVLDFGLAKLTEGLPGESATGQPGAGNSTDAASLTLPGRVLGTLRYMSPEQARGLKLDARTDIFSLGVVLYELLTGESPFVGATTADVIAAVLEREPPPLLNYATGVPPALARIVSKALRKDREQRYQTSQELLNDLKDLQHELEFSTGERAAAQPTSTLSSGQILLGEVKRHKPGALIALLTLIAIATAAYLYLAPGSKAQINSIAVLPFANTSGDPNMEYLSDGISESLINALAQLPGVKVIARGSAFKYKGKEFDPEEVARALGVQAIVTGRVAQHGDSLQISAELMDARDKSQMWGEQFNRKAADLLPVQAEISRQIVEKLRLRLTSTEQQQLVKGTQVNAQAYELFLKGRFHRAKRTAENLQQAVEYFNQAVALEPNYALAHAALADAYRYMGANGYRDPKEMTPKAEAEAQRALALDESLPQVHSALAGIKKDAWDWAGAERAYKRAIELNPNLAAERSGYAYFLSTQQRHEQALIEVKKASELDPLAIAYRANIGHVLYFARQYEQAIKQLKQTLELDRNHEYSHVVLGYVYAASGRYAEALAEYKETSRLGGDTTSLQCYLGYALAKLGQRREAEAILKQLETSKAYVSPAELALLYLGLGEQEKALSALEQAYAAHDVQMQFLTADPHYDGLHADPRFVDLLRRVGLPQ